MTNLARVRITLSGFQGGPGVTTFYVLNPTTAMPELKGLMAGFLTKMPSVITCTYPTTGDYIDPVTGILAGSWIVSGLANDAGATSDSYSAPSGILVSWLTGGILDGHRLRGRTFFVPVSGSAYQSDGSVIDAARSTLQTTVNSKVSTLANNLVVWHRPRAASAAHPVDRAGGYDIVTAGLVSDKVAVLRSRRP